MSLKMTIISLIGGRFALTANLVAQAWVDSHPLLFVALNISFGYVIVSIVISHVGGWASLARRFRFRGQFHGSRWRGQNGQMRWIAGYHNCLTVGANENGLYLPGFPFLLLGHPPLLIPWNEVSHAKRMTLFYPMVRFGDRAAWLNGKKREETRGKSKELLTGSGFLMEGPWTAIAGFLFPEK